MSTSALNLSTLGVPFSGGFPSGYKLLLRGTFTDESGNGNNASTTSGHNSPQSGATGIDNQPSIYWDGNSIPKSIQTPLFLSGASAATSYVVYRPSASNPQWTLISTTENQPWTSYGSGTNYEGCFRTSRLEAPFNIDTAADGVYSIHADSSNYKIYINNIQKVSASANFNVGSFFRIGDYDGQRNFKGHINLVLVYPTYLDPLGAEHSRVIATIKKVFTSLPL